MKNFKEHKVQILAALALAFSLGLVMPTVLVSEGAYAATNEEKEITAADLYAAYNKVKADGGYNKYHALYEAQKTLAEHLSDATAEQIKAATDAIAQIVTEGAQVGDMDAPELNQYILTSIPDYAAWSAVLSVMAEIEEATGTVSEENIRTKMATDQIKADYATLNNFNNRVTGTRADNIVKLYNRIEGTEEGYGFGGYKQAEKLVEDVAVLQNPGAATESQVETAKSDLINQMKTLLPTVAVDEDMEDAELIAAARNLTDFDKYMALYQSMGFLRALGTVNATTIATKYTPSQQKTNYDLMATAAYAINPEVMTGLMAFSGAEVPDELPNTSVGGDKEENKNPNTPNAGIVGLFESGALDLQTITLIASVAVAGIAGAVLIAKLYLKHKF